MFSYKYYFDIFHAKQIKIVVLLDKTPITYIFTVIQFREKKNSHFSTLVNQRVFIFGYLDVKQKMMTSG